MIVTLSRLAEQVILADGGGTRNRDSELLEDDVIFIIRQVAGEMMKMMYFQSIKTEDVHDVPHHFIYSYPVDVSFDEARKQSYVVLPDVPSSLPGNKGLRAVTTEKNPNNPIPIIHEGQIAMIQGFIGNEAVAYPEGKKVFFSVDFGKKNIKKVLLKIVTAIPEALGSDEQVYIPYDMQAQIIAETIKRVQRKPQDNAGDGNPTP